MRFTQTPLYIKAIPKMPRHVQILIALLVIITPMHAVGMLENSREPYTKTFIITAYYSPLPGQCCYVKGGYKADQILNGDGTHAADGTAVYEGMLAAPPSYAFGTKVHLPGIGVLTVHDRGGAIQELSNGHDRLDIWVGHGEEGLARALAFGVQTIEGTVYPKNSDQPGNSFVLENLPAPLERLKQYFVEKGNILALRPKEGERGLSVLIVQEYLRDLGYFDHAVTGLFGPVTSSALKEFLNDYGLDASSRTLTEEAAAYLIAAKKRQEARQPIDEFIDNGSSRSALYEAQRILRYLGEYSGRTDGEYSEELKTAILHFQQKHRLVGTWDDPGAGRIGPVTRKTLRQEWNKRIVAQHAENHLDLYEVEKKTSARGERIEQYLGEGYYGSQVRLLQRLLAKFGFFPKEEINGSYGPLTKDSVLRYQLSRGIINSASEKGAGYVGPSTMSVLRNEQKLDLYRLVRAEGWNAL